MNEAATPTPQQRIAKLEEQLDALHDHNLHLEFRLRQREAENEDYEKDYLAVWKALRPRHGVSFMQDHENIVQSVQRLVNEVPTLNALLEHAESKFKLAEESIHTAGKRGCISAIAQVIDREDVGLEAIHHLIHFIGGVELLRQFGTPADLRKITGGGFLKTNTLSTDPR